MNTREIKWLVSLAVSLLTLYSLYQNRPPRFR